MNPSRCVKSATRLSIGVALSLSAVGLSAPGLAAQWTPEMVTPD
jgi:hypothetical protein